MTIDMSPGTAAAPAGPRVERHGSASPWPCDGFDVGGGP